MGGAAASDGQQHHTPWRPAIAIDAVSKLNHYKSGSGVCPDLRPQIHRCFGEADAQMSAAHASSSTGKVSLCHTMRVAAAGDGGAEAVGAAPADDDDSTGTHACASTLTCSRPVAAAASNTPCDVHGVCGAVCMHTVPVRGSFVDLPAPESFSPYLLILNKLMRERADLKVGRVCRQGLVCMLKCPAKLRMSVSGSPPSRVVPHVLSPPAGLACFAAAALRCCLGRLHRLWVPLQDHVAALPGRAP